MTAYNDLQHLIGDSEVVSVERALAEIRSGRLILAPPRLRLLGYDSAEPAFIPLGGKPAAAIHEIVSHTTARLNGVAPAGTGDIDKAALELVRLAYLLPAAITVGAATFQLGERHARCDPPLPARGGQHAEHRCPGSRAA